MEHTSSFQPCQIICLEYETSRLYAEVVQIIERRQICWARPLLLAIGPVEDCATYELPTQEHWYDLRDGSDLLLPLILFRAAFDSEVLPLLTYLYNPCERISDEKCDRTEHQQLNQFIHQIWRAHPEAFQL